MDTTISTLKKVLIDIFGESNSFEDKRMNAWGVNFPVKNDFYQYTILDENDKIILMASLPFLVTNSPASMNILAGMEKILNENLRFDASLRLSDDFNDAGRVICIVLFKKNDNKIDKEKVKALISFTLEVENLLKGKKQI